MIRHFLRRSRKASVAVEFALVSVFVLLPLTLGGTDLFMMITAQAQLNTALQALYYYSWASPTATAADNFTYANDIITTINSASVYHIALPAKLPSGAANGSISYGCFDPPSSASTTITYQTSPCSSTQTQQTMVNYQVTTSIVLPVVLPGIPSHLTLSSSGKVQTQ